MDPEALANLFKAGCYRAAVQVAMRSGRKKQAAAGNQGPQLNVFSSGC
jgi:hypothetical protein